MNSVSPLSNVRFWSNTPPVARFLKNMSLWEGIVVSNSMAPLIWTGDRVLWQRVAPESIHLFDIVSFSVSSKKIVAHRVIRLYPRKRQNFFVTRGDNAGFTDNPVRTEQVLGKALTVNSGKDQFHLALVPHELMYFASLTPFAFIRQWTRWLIFTPFGRKIINPMVKTVMKILSA